MTRPIIGPALAATFTTGIGLLLITSPLIAGLLMAVIYPFAHGIARWLAGR
jgi:hypothetical protein